jgi:hypothetical protein
VDWLINTEAERTLRHEPILRAFFRWTLQPDEAARQFRADAHAYAAKLAELENQAHSIDDWDSSPAAYSGRLALEAGIRLYRDLNEWAEWAAERVQAGPSGSPNPRPANPGGGD